MLVIIGLILGAVLKGQELIFNARVKKMKNDIDSLTAAVYTYQDRYGYLPGDDPSASSHVGSSFNGDGDGIIDGSETSGEGLYVWDHLHLARLIAGSGTNRTACPFGGEYGFDQETFTGLGSRNAITVENVPAEVCRHLDEKYDDGLWNAGTIQGSGNYQTGTGNYTLRIML